MQISTIRIQTCASMSSVTSSQIVLHALLPHILHFSCLRTMSSSSTFSLAPPSCGVNLILIDRIHRTASSIVPYSAVWGVDIPSSRATRPSRIADSSCCHSGAGSADGQWKMAAAALARNGSVYRISAQLSLWVETSKSYSGTQSGLFYISAPYLRPIIPSPCVFAT